MKPLYGRSKRINDYVNIIPAEALTGDDVYDTAVCCAIWTASGLMTKEQLAKIADRIRAIHPNYPTQVAKTCKMIAREELGYIYLIEAVID